MCETDLIQRLTAAEQRSKSNTHQIEELKRSTEALNELAKAVALMAQEQKHQGEKLDEVVADVKTIKEEPADHWKELCRTALTAIVSAVFAYFMARMGLQM